MKERTLEETCLRFVGRMCMYIYIYICIYIYIFINVYSSEYLVLRTLRSFGMSFYLLLVTAARSHDTQKDHRVEGTLVK
jgi:hypothetical protein